MSEQGPGAKLVKAVTRFAREHDAQFVMVGGLRWTAPKSAAWRSLERWLPLALASPHAKDVITVDVWSSVADRQELLGSYPYGTRERVELRRALAPDGQDEPERAREPETEPEPERSPREELEDMMKMLAMAKAVWQ